MKPDPRYFSPSAPGVGRRLVTVLIGLMVLSGSARGAVSAAETTLLNVSYDVTREFYQDINTAFAAQWTAPTGGKIVIHQSHGGSSKQAQSVLNGLEADVVTMNQPTDIDLLFRRRLVPLNWAARLPNHSVPFTSTIVFVVRRGNPKHIHTRASSPQAAAMSPSPPAAASMWASLASPPTTVATLRCSLKTAT
jgi:sulfate/thiosulfate transport system substrate-binding protein